MIIYTGGRVQGKTELVLKKYSDINKRFSGKDYFSLCGFLRGDTGSGRIFIDDMHLIIRSMMESCCELGDYDELLDELIGLLTDEKIRDRIIITGCEIGSGVVPMDRFEERWRELNGRCMIRLAEIAEEVYLVNCGLEQRIK